MFVSGLWVNLLASCHRCFSLVHTGPDVANLLASERRSPGERKAGLGDRSRGLNGGSRG